MTDASLMDPCIICVAITGSVPSKADNPAVPITVTEQIESTHEAFEADKDAVATRAREAGVEVVIVNGLEPISNREVLECVHSLLSRR